MKDISIIVPIYNSEEYIERCIDSLINQTKKELEFILINDGSTDNTEKKIKNYEDKRIKYFKNKNQGIGKSRNFGIEKASGKYIMFLDSDDYLELDSCEKLYSYVEKEKVDMAVCNFYRVIDGQKIKEKINEFEISSLKENPELLLNINLAPWNKLYKRKIIVENNIKFEEKLKYEDAPFVVNALVNSKRIGYLDEYLNNYVIHSDSETTIRDRKVFDIIEIVDIIRNNLKDKMYIKENLDKLTVRILTNYTIQQRVNIDKKVGMEFIDKAFYYMKKNIPDYRKNKYYKNRTFLQRMIEKNRILTKIYCLIYRIVN